jgi:hypothetical protein
MKPVALDDNGFALISRGTELFTTRMESVGAFDQDIALPTDFKEILIHVEAGADVLLVTGTVAGSATAHLTDGEVNLKLCIAAEISRTVARIASGSGARSVSIFAIR